MTNIAEGFDCESKAAFARFLGYSRRSVVEVRSLLYTAFDIEYVNEIQQRHDDKREGIDFISLTGRLDLK
jgi:four helix bundle protein